MPVNQTLIKLQYFLYIKPACLGHFIGRSYIVITLLESILLWYVCVTIFRIFNFRWSIWELIFIHKVSSSPHILLSFKHLFLICFSTKCFCLLIQSIQSEFIALIELAWSKIVFMMESFFLFLIYITLALFSPTRKRSKLAWILHLKLIKYSKNMLTVYVIASKILAVASYFPFFIHQYSNLMYSTIIVIFHLKYGTITFNVFQMHNLRLAFNARYHSHYKLMAFLILEEHLFKSPSGVMLI